MVLRFVSIVAAAVLLLGAGCSTGLDGKTFDLARDAGGGASTGTGGQAAGGTGGTTSSGGGGAGAVGGGGSAACDGLVTDTFEDPTTVTECWSSLDLQEVQQFGVDQGRLRIQPSPMTGWWTAGPADGAAPMLYKETGDNFVVATHVRVQTPNDGAPPTGDFDVAGILVRAPRAIGGAPADESWVKWELGRRQAALDDDPMGLLAAASIDGNPHHVVPYANIPAQEGELGVCRLGPQLALFWRPDTNGAWTQLYIVGPEESASHVGPMLDAVVQVGLTTGSLNPGGNVVGLFEWVWFSPTPPTDLGECLAMLGAMTAPGD